jgi:hypothetical protein
MPVSFRVSPADFILGQRGESLRVAGRAGWSPGFFPYYRIEQFPALSQVRSFSPFLEQLQLSTPARSHLNPASSSVFRLASGRGESSVPNAPAALRKKAVAKTQIDRRLIFILHS